MYRVRYQIGSLGGWMEVPQAAQAIYHGDLPALQALHQAGLDLNEALPLGSFSTALPLEVAVYCNQLEITRWLLDHGAQPQSAAQPLLLAAARNGSPELLRLFLWQAGAMDSSQRERLYEEIQAGDLPDNVQVLDQAGIPVARYGGAAFRAAVANGQMDLVQVMIQRGVDLNHHRPAPEFPFGSTPVIEAARYDDFPLVQLLVEHGADVTIPDQYGERPYILAVQNQNQEMAAYLKALEPAAWHDQQERERQLRPYCLPESMAQQLKDGPLYLEFPGFGPIQWARFHTYTDLQEFLWQGQPFLSLLADLDGYGNLLLAWNPGDHQLWYGDIEEGVFYPLATWESFLTQPGVYFNRLVTDELGA